MSKVLRRPMFRGGRVDSRGTGITSGLDEGYADGGRVGFQGGGDYFTNTQFGSGGPGMGSPRAYESFKDFLEQINISYPELDIIDIYDNNPSDAIKILEGMGLISEGKKDMKTKIAIDANGAITSVQIISGGSAYGIGNTLTVVGVATTAGHVVGVVSVTSIYNNVGDVIRLSGVSSEYYQGYNSLYRISSVENSRTIVATSATTVSGFSTTGVPSALITDSYIYNTGKSIPISSLTYDNVSGIATVVTSATSHGLDVGNVVSLVGATTSLYNGDFVVSEDLDLTTFRLNIGASTNHGFATWLYRGHSALCIDIALSTQFLNLYSRLFCWGRFCSWS